MVSDTAGLIWGRRIVKTDSLETIEDQLITLSGSDIVSTLCPLANVSGADGLMAQDCNDLFGIASEDLLKVKLGEPYLTPNVEPVLFDADVSTDNIARLLHSLAFLKAADQYFKDMDQDQYLGQPLPVHPIVKRNMERIFTAAARSSWTFPELLEQIQATHGYREYEGGLTYDQKRLEPLVEEGFRPAVLLLHQLTKNFHSRVAGKRHAEASFAPSLGPVSDGFTSYLISQIEERKKTGDQSCNSILLYVHGYNGKLNDTIKDVAYISIDSDFCGVPVLFSWPSQGKGFEIGKCLTNNWPTLGELPRYWNQKDIDRTSDEKCHSLAERGVQRCGSVYQEDRMEAHGAIDAFERVVTALYDPRLSQTKVHIITHSLGADMVTEWIERYRGSPIRSNGSGPARAASLSLIAPDASADQFAGLNEKLVNTAVEVNIFGSELDTALAGSSCLNKLDHEDQIAIDPAHAGKSDNADRLGLLSEKTLNLPAPIRTFDISGILYRGGSNHSFHRSNKRFASEMRSVLAGRPPEVQHSDIGDKREVSEQYPSHTPLLDTSVLEDVILPEDLETFWVSKLKISHRSSTN